MNSYCARSSAAIQRGGSAFLLLILIVGSAWITNSQASTSTPLPVPAARLKQDTAPVGVYGNSVIPGGVHGPSELTSALARDQIARVHYASFDSANAYIVHVKKARLVHVSYRMGDKIYWTKKKVRLAVGEALLTDGKSFVRTRCGNRIANLPQVMVSNMEPAPEVLDTLLAAPLAEVSSVAPASAELHLAAINGFAGNAENAGAPRDSTLASSLQGSAPSFAPQTSLPLATQTPTLARALAAVELDRVKALVPALAEAIVNAGVPLLLVGSTSAAPVTPATQATWSPTPGSGIAPETILAAFPSPSSAFPASPMILVTGDAPSNAPEPATFALALLALILIALIRPRGQRK